MFKRLLVPVDGSLLAEEAVGRAVTIARVSGASIDVVQVQQPRFGAADDSAEVYEGMSAGRNYLEAITDEWIAAAGVAATYVVLRGMAVEMICQRAAVIDADLIVMTSHGRTGLKRAVLGSVADGVIRHSSTPVLMLPPAESALERRRANQPFRRVLVPLDRSAMSKETIAAGRNLAGNPGAHLLLLRIVQPVPQISEDVLASLSPRGLYPMSVTDELATASLCDEAADELVAVARGFERDGMCQVRTHVVIARSVGGAIVAFARHHGVDVIAMSTHGRGASRLLIGSVADQVLRESHLPIFLRRPASEDVAPLFDREDVEAQLSALTST